MFNWVDLFQISWAAITSAACTMLRLVTRWVGKIRGMAAEVEQAAAG